MANVTKIKRDEIMKLARELGMALAQSEEIYAYREAEKEAAQDSEACQLTRNFKEAHQNLAQKLMDPTSIPEDSEQLNAILEHADQAMKSNSIIKEYYRTGNTFNNLIYQINQLLKFYCIDPNEDIPSEQSGGCSNCNGGCTK
ncbi:MAG: YlbF family regulator [Clostridiales bacterium]|nr:YlbF family regulator [Clostridiales bacterium]